MTQLVKTMKLYLNGLKVSCCTSGESGPPVILLHGAGVDSAMIPWGEVIGPLSES